MKSFLLKDKIPIIPFSLLPDNTFFEGVVPLNFNLAVCPGKYIVLDVDIDVNKGKNGFNHIPSNIYFETRETFNYTTNRGGSHYWLFYTGDKILANKTSGLDIDLRIGEKKGNAGGYVKYTHDVDIRNCTHLIKDTSLLLNEWLEKLFSYVNK